MVNTGLCDDNLSRKRKRQVLPAWIAARFSAVQSVSVGYDCGCISEVCVHRLNAVDWEDLRKEITERLPNVKDIIVNGQPVYFM